MIPLQYDYQGKDAAVVPGDGSAVNQVTTFSYPEDRWLVGWVPWIGFDRGSICECHLALFVGDKNAFNVGPHKEADLTFYDNAKAEFYPAGYGLFIPAKTTLTLDFLIHSTCAGVQFRAQANARIYTVLNVSDPRQ